MKQHTTSHRIASMITRIVLSVMGMFGLIINVVNFWSRYRVPDAGLQELLWTDATSSHDEPYSGVDSLFSLSGEEDFDQTRFPLLVTEKSDSYRDFYVVFSVDGQPHAQRVTPLVEGQILLGIATVIFLVVMGVALYFIARYVAKRSLRDVQTISDHITSTSTDTLDRPLMIPHLSDRDELQPIIQGLNTSNRQLHHQLNAIKQFVSGVSHEFRTPLAILQAKIQLAKIKDNPTDVLHSIESQGKSMQKLLDTLLLLTKIEHQDIHTEPVDLHDLTNHIDTDHSCIYAEKHITSTIDGQATITAHPGLVSLILTNLIDNAYKHSPSHSAITITIDQQSITIANDGDQLDQETLDAMFDPFWQGDRSKHTAGFGLGLALVKQSADALGRSVSASARGAGGCLITLLFS